jgi:trimeric autotransporter adhesin
MNKFFAKFSSSKVVLLACLIFINYTSATAQCSGIPVAGVAYGKLATTATCANKALTLTAVGATTGTGIAYQWQQAPIATGIWANVVGGGAATVTTIPPASINYRFRVICSNTNDTTYSNILTMTLPLTISGNFTIDKTQPTNWPTTPGGINFNSFTDAYNAIKCGIAGAITFNVAPATGPYLERLLMNTIPGTSAINTIVFKGNGNTITFPTATTAITTERAVIRLNNVSYVTFDSLNVDASNSTTFGFGFHLLRDANNNTIKNCTVLASQAVAATTANFAGIVISGSPSSAVGTGRGLCDSNKIYNNTVTGGYYGITATATYPDSSNGSNEIVGNTIKDFYFYGIYMNGNYRTLIKENSISRPNRSIVSDFQGIYFTGGNDLCVVSKNRIFNPFGGNKASTAAFVGINFFNNTTFLGFDHSVENNLIFNVNNSGAQTGFANSASGSIGYIHNTVSLDSGAASGAVIKCFSQTGASPSLSILNNLFSVTKQGTGAKNCISLATQPALMDNNNYYISPLGGSNNLGFYGSNRANIFAWRTALAGLSLDQNAISEDPAYFDAPNNIYSPTNAAMDNKGVALGIVEDINSAPRSLSTPDIGCYEFVPPPCIPAALNGTTEIVINSVINPLNDTVCENTIVKLNVKIGGPYGNAQTFQWQTSTSASGPWVDLGAPKVTPDTAIAVSSSLYYRCNIVCSPNNKETDVKKVIVIKSMPAGNYTIDNTMPSTYISGLVGTNFNKWDSIRFYLNVCGASGTGGLFFKVAPASGPYNEQFMLDSFAGIDVNNQLYFDGSNRTIAFSPTVNTERAVIKLKKTHYANFSNLVIDASSATNFGYAVQLLNNADSNSFKNCTFLANNTLPANALAGVVINATDAGNPLAVGNSKCDNNIFESNTFDGGYYSVAASGTVASPISRNVFKNNSFLNFYNIGFALQGADKTQIEGNTFSRPTRSNVMAGVGINLSTVLSINTLITKNKFTNFYGGLPTSALGATGIAINGLKPTTGNDNLVNNNIFYNLGGIGVINALSHIASDNVFYFHNSISIDDTASGTSPVAGFLQTGASVGIQFKNNLISITRKNTASNHCVNFTTPDITLDYNNYYINTASNYYVGKFGATSYNKLLNWKKAFTFPTQDSLSLDLEPLFVNANGGNLIPQMLPLDNKGKDVGIVDDIFNNPRAGIPDIGAIEFTPPLCPALTASFATVLLPTPNTGICYEIPIRLTVIGHPPLGQITFQWQDSMPGVAGWSNLGPLLYNPIYDTISTARNFYRCIITCAATGVFNVSATTSVVLNNILPGGTYTIDGSIATTSFVNPQPGDNFKTYNDAVSAMTCGILGSVIFDVKPGIYNEQVRIPYIPAISSSKTITFQGFNGNTTANNLTFKDTVATKNYTLRVDSSKFITFKNLTISSENAINCRVIDIVNGSNNINILNCNITAPTTTSTNLTNAGICATPIRGNNIIIKNNTISNGVSGVYFAGSNTRYANIGHAIVNNTIVAPLIYGITARFTNGLLLDSNTVNVATPSNASAIGIHALNCNNGVSIKNNNINIGNITNLFFGIQLEACLGTGNNKSMVRNNTIIADTFCNAVVNGIRLTKNAFAFVVNNVVAITKSTGATAGISWANDNVDSVEVYNNSVNITGNNSASAAFSYNQTSAGNFFVQNNIFSNFAGGKAMAFVANSSLISDYNMLYSSGINLISRGTTNYTTIAAFAASPAASELFGFNYPPTFTSNTNLRPNINNQSVWGMHGRGVQIKRFTYDFDGKFRPDSLELGVPDFGAFEFYPAVPPPLCTAIPATPVLLGEQIFYFGSDTVMRIKWRDSTFVPHIAKVQRFSGVVPPTLKQSGRRDSMYFYTKVDVDLPNKYKYDTKLGYVDSWLGSIPKVGGGIFQLGLGKIFSNTRWDVTASSQSNQLEHFIYDSSNTFLDQFSGLINSNIKPPARDSNLSNIGKNFWVAYQLTQNFGANGDSLNNLEPNMRLYFSAGAKPAKVQINCYGTNKSYYVYVPANSSRKSPVMPANFGGNGQDSRIKTEGKFNKGINITSDEPIAAYAHIYAGANSGATMLMPVITYGNEYYTLNLRQEWGIGQDVVSCFYVVAAYDNTRVEITPSKKTQGGINANQVRTVDLNKGDVYQVLGLTDDDGTQEFSGSRIKSIEGPDGVCKPTGVFCGTTRSSLTCNNTSSSGDVTMQQIFPYQAWGKLFLTAPTHRTSGSPNTIAISSTNVNNNVYRIVRRDRTSTVKRNGVVIPPAAWTTTVGTINYCNFESNSTDKITSDTPILVAQYIPSSGSCGNVGLGDPEMFFLSSLELGVKKSTFYRSTLADSTDAGTNFVTFITHKNALNSIKLDGIYLFRVGSIPPSQIPPPRKVYYKHRDTNYIVCTVSWDFLTATPIRTSTIESDSIFVGTVYGLGSVESYGYNIGTLLKDLRVKNELNVIGAAPGYNYACPDVPFKFSTYLPYPNPDSILWKFSSILNLTPNVDLVQKFPTYVSSKPDGVNTLYQFVVPTAFSSNQAGTDTLRVVYWHQDIDACNKSYTSDIGFEIRNKPNINILRNNNICLNDSGLFISGKTSNNVNQVPIDTFRWTINGSVVSTKDSMFYASTTADSIKVNLYFKTADACFGDTSFGFRVHALPVPKITTKFSTCANDTAILKSDSLSVNNIAISNYTWYANNDTTVKMGNSISNVYPTSGTFYDTLKVTSINGCKGQAIETIVVNANPKPKIATTFSGCENSMAQFVADSFLTGGINISSWNWTFHDTTKKVGYISSYIYPKNGTYIERLDVVSANGCKGFVFDTVTVLPNPIPSINKVFDGCETGVVHLKTPNTSVNGLPLTSFNWALHDSTKYTGDSINYNYPVAGTYVVTLTVATNNGCLGKVYDTIVVNANPVVSLVKDSVLVCPNNTANFIVKNPIASATYNWFAAPTGGSILATQTSYAINNVTAPNTYYVEATNKNCVSVVRKPGFVDVLTNLNPPVAVGTLNQPNYITWTWNKIAGATDYEIKLNSSSNWVKITPSLDTFYTKSNLPSNYFDSLTVRAIGVDTCINATSRAAFGKTINNGVFVPNVFTPNGQNNNNNYFVICAMALSELKVVIFNQWGQKIAETNTKEIDGVNQNCYRVWDGKHNGVLQPSGVYMYYGRFVTIDGKVQEKKGTINLIR